MNRKTTALQKVKRTVAEQQQRVLVKAVISLIFNLLFAFYNGIWGILSASPIFAASSVYYLLLSAMRFFAVMRERQNQRSAPIIGVMLIVLGALFPMMVTISMRDQTAALYGTIPMITIATYTFTKITLAVMTAVKHRGKSNRLLHAINAIRYSEVAVSLLTMQQSMLVSFGEANAPSAVILNSCTGAGVCCFILVLGIITLKNNRKDFNL